MIDTEKDRRPPSGVRSPGGHAGAVQSLRDAVAQRASQRDSAAAERVLRPLAYRQQQVDGALAEAVEAVRRSFAHRMEALRRRSGADARAIPVEHARHASADRLLRADLMIGEMLLSRDDFISEVIAEHRMWEPDLSVYMKRLVRPGMTVVDIGANFGYFSVMSSRLVRGRGRVIAVEPDAENRALLQANLWRNRCANAAVLPMAAYSENGHIQMMMNPMGGSGHWIEPAGGFENWGGEEDAQAGLLVPCARLDDALTHRPVDVVKIDAQGADHLAIRGMERILRMSPDVTIIAEFLPERPAVDGESPDGVLRYYQDMGFELCMLAPNGTMLPATRSEILASGEQLDVQNLGLRWRRGQSRAAQMPRWAPSAADALARVRARLAGDDWSEPSSHGRLGLLARRSLRRVLKPYATRQAAFDATLADAIEEVATDLDSGIEALEREVGLNPEASFVRLAEVLDPNLVVEGDTDVGMLWVHRDEPLISGQILQDRGWEQDVSAMLRSVLRPGMTFVDVGANVGYFMALAADIVGPEGRVIAVEADPANAAIVKANLWRRGVHGASVLPIAAYSETGHVPMTAGADSPTNSYVKLNAGEFEGRLVPCARLDDVLEVETVDVVKIDAEGSDHHVVRGMREILDRSPGAIVAVELFLAETDLGQERPVDILESYREMGFTLNRIGGAGELVPATVEQVLAVEQSLVQIVLTRS